LSYKKFQIARKFHAVFFYFAGKFFIAAKYISEKINIGGKLLC